MTIPTGPAIVGLELVVLPCRVEVGVLDPGLPSLEIWAPRCRYGYATYDVACQLAGESMLTSCYLKIVGGTSRAVRARRRRKRWPVRYVLRLLSLAVAPGALDYLGQAEMVEALAHPLRSVREAAILSARPIEVEERALIDAAEAAKQAYRAERRKKGE